MWQIRARENSLEIQGVTDFNLQHVFDCGQCFRWTKQPDGSYTGIALGKVLNVQLCPQDEAGNGTLILTGCSQEEFLSSWLNYFDLKRNYGQLKRKLSEHDEVMARAIGQGEGIRILRQDVWETIISFIISQNNNIPRIKKCIESLCETFGNPILGFDGQVYHDFPTPERLANASPKEMASCKLGYRAHYIMETSKTIAQMGQQQLNEIAQAERGAAEASLLSLCGVGPKVANCILLFAMGNYDAFPVDVWMRRVMNRLYGIAEGDMEAMKDYAQEHFSPYGGIAQQYLFYYIRNLESII